MQKSCIICLCLLIAFTVQTSSRAEDKDDKVDKKKVEVTEAHYRIYKGNGEAVSLDQLLSRLQSSDVIFLGESHNDPVAHHLELLLLKKLSERRETAGSAPRPLALSMEMIERDVQHIVEEYLTDLITEQHFKASSRPWKNYDDYRPLIEHAKSKKLAVIAANAPRRYVNLVGREGMEGLKKVQNPMQNGLPPIPYAKASPAYTAKFKSLMSQHMKTPKKEEKSQEKKEETKEEKKPTPKRPTDAKKPPVRKFDMDKALQAQSLWDASMAYSIVEHLLSQPRAQVLHINGSFHTEKRLGIPEHLLRYRPGTNCVVVTMTSHKSFPKFDVKEMTGLGDFVIVTDPSLPRSYSSPSKSSHEKKKPKIVEKKTTPNT